MILSSTLEDPVFILSCVLSGVGVLFSVGTLTFNIYHRHSRLIKMSSPNLNAVINLGSVLGYITCLLFGLATLDIDGASAICQIRIWLLPIAFSLVFGPLIAKSWRVRRIFQQMPAKRVVIKDIRLLLMVIALLFLDVIILTTWFILDPVSGVNVTRMIEVRDVSSLHILSSTTSTTSQCWSTYSPVWTSGLAAIKVASLLYGLYLAWAVRGVTLPTMNESPCIAGSSLTAVLLASLLQVLASWLGHLPMAVNACAVITIWFITTTTLSLLYLPKIYYWWKSADDEVVKLSFAASQSMCSPSQMHSSGDEDFYTAVDNQTYGKHMPKRDVIKSKNNETDPELTEINGNHEDRQKDSGIDAECSSGSQQDTGIGGSGEALFPSESKSKRDSGYATGAKNPSQFCSLQDNRSDPIQYAGFKEQSTTNSWATPVQYQKNPRKAPANSAYRYMQSYTGSDSNSYNIHSGPFRRQHRFSSTKINPGDSLSDIELEISTPRSSFRESGKSHEAGLLHVCEHPARRYEIAGSIVQSLDLDDDSDTYSYISHRLSVPNNQRYFENGGYATDQESTLHASSDISSSRDSLSTIGNDSYYPQFAKVCSRNMRQKRRQIRRCHNHEPQTNLYFIQMPPPARLHVPSCGNMENYYGDDSTEV